MRPPEGLEASYLRDEAETYRELAEERRCPPNAKGALVLAADWLDQAAERIDQANKEEAQQ